MSTSYTEVNRGEEGNTKSSSRYRGWCFTLNNYTEADLTEVPQMLQKFCVKYVVGKEVGEKCGTPHLQGWMYFKNAKSFSAVKKMHKRWSIRVAVGGEEANRVYCSKENVLSELNIVNFKVTLIKKCLDRYEDVQWKYWQKDILDELEKEPDSRTINWVVDKKGNSGKSFLAKYLALTKSIIIADGKKDNVFNQINNTLNPKVGEGKEFDIVILDVPRSAVGYINYGVLEQIKNGLIYSGKYEGGMCIFDNVHVVVFANEEPDYEEFSKDRWNIIEIEE